MLFQTSIGIEVQSDQFSVVALKTGLGRVRLVGHSTFSFGADGDLATSEKVRIISDAIREMMHQHQVAPTDFCLGIPRELVIVREIQLPVSVKENLRTTLTYEMSKYIPLAVDEIYFDHLIIEENRPENRLRLLLFVVRKRDVDAYLGLAAHFGQKLSGLELDATAIGAYIAAFPLDADRYECGLIRFESNASQLCVYRRGVLEWSKYLNFSETNGALKTKILEAITAFQSQRKSEIKWFCPTNDKNNALLAELKDEASLEIHLFDPQPAGLPTSDLVPACGLSLRGLGKTQSGINFLPPELRKKPNRKSYYTMLALIVLTIMAALSWGGSRVIQHRMAVGRLDAELRNLQPEVVQVEKLSKESDEIEAQIKKIEAMEKERISVLSTLEELSVRIPVTAWVEEVRLKADGARITGYADSASDLVTILENSPIFDNVVFLSAITRTPEGKERFLIGMRFEKNNLGPGLQ